MFLKLMDKKYKMKKIKIIALGAIAVAVAACGTNGQAPEQHPFEVESEFPQKSLIDSVSYYIGFNFGYFIKDNGFNEKVVNMNEIRKGLQDYLKATSPNDTTAFKYNPKDINPTFRKYLSMMAKYNNEVNLKEGEIFLEANKEKEGVEVCESGLQYKIIEAGNEVKPGPKDTVDVIYTGTFIDGTEFDSSKGEPVTMPLSIFIEGWQEGLPKIGEGGKIELYIPASLAYGQGQRGPIPGNSTLIFNVELVKVSPYVEKENDGKSGAKVMTPKAFKGKTVEK